ncbi:hypothetical protein JOF53_007621 [Crossiella equi]|uniref:Uncharacterized protein n=1 Tax=Crossiella equi TaxID=130796 RepID=A0ABS5AR99_9PSEU|nr:hypothetical protein [Crossiella equi]MBP2478749.1 hypothetical protein [Crossiella equi]
MGKRTRDLLLLTGCLACIGAAGLYIRGIMTDLSGPPVRSGQAAVELTGKREQSSAEIRLTETLRVGPAQNAQVVPSGTVLKVKASLLPEGDGPLRCTLAVQAGQNETPRVEVSSCELTTSAQRL